MSTVVAGRVGEDLAVEYLEEQGWRVLERNWHGSAGEIDVVAEETTSTGPVTVFIEVKYRTGQGFGDPLEAITCRKVRRLRATCAEWLASHGGAQNIRIDAIGILKLPGWASRLQHLRGLA